MALSPITLAKVVWAPAIKTPSIAHLLFIEHVSGSGRILVTVKEVGKIKAQISGSDIRTLRCNIGRGIVNSSQILIISYVKTFVVLLKKIEREHFGIKIYLGIKR